MAKAALGYLRRACKVAYPADIANLLSAQLTKFVGSQRHEIAEEAPHLDFWVGEVRHCLAVTDGYGRRFEPSMARDLSKALPIASSRRVPDHELRRARRALCDAAYRLLVRMLHEGLIVEATLRDACARLGLGVEECDLLART